ncbi:MAG TPA: copper homeostasis membrane protein CopD [Rhizomicrobium sp.]|nr:copper homeostasis membrane protein CopD [Rhizomicrobium sp.]
MPLDAAIIILRFVQYSAAMVLFGSSLFLLYGGLLQPRPGALASWPNRLLLLAALAIVVAAPLQFIIQTAMLAGLPPFALDAGTLKASLLEMSFGKSSLIRLALALIAWVGIWLLPAGRAIGLSVTTLGALICASFAWMGHGAATENAYGWLHLTADVTHSLGAAGWIGALVVFWIATQPELLDPIHLTDLCQSLRRFSGIGILFVAIITVSGLVNSVFLIGINPVQAVSTRYGQVLALKLAIFIIMLGLAAANRFRHVPALGRALADRASVGNLHRLRLSICMETIAAVLILALVSWLGTLQPPAAQ